MSKKTKPTVRDCRGCRDDFYNHNGMGLNETDQGPRCWSLATAEFVKVRIVHVDLRPPYKHVPLEKRPNCFRPSKHVAIRPEALDAAGYWRTR